MRNGKVRNKAMPQISQFFGIFIYMYYNEHNPPHFHAWYNEFSAQVRISDFVVMEGKLPPRVIGMVIEWATLHQNELNENWIRSEKLLPLVKIEPLV